MQRQRTVPGKTILPVLSSPQQKCRPSYLPAGICVCVRVCLWWDKDENMPRVTQQSLSLRSSSNTHRRTLFILQQRSLVLTLSFSSLPPPISPVSVFLHLSLLFLFSFPSISVPFMVKCLVETSFFVWVTHCQMHRQHRGLEHLSSGEMQSGTTLSPALLSSVLTHHSQRWDDPGVNPPFLWWLFSPETGQCNQSKYNPYGLTFCKT